MEGINEKAPLTFKDRLLIEKQQVDERLEKLGEFLKGDKFKSIDTIQQSLLNVQHSAMETYSRCLAERIHWLEMPADVAG